MKSSEELIQILAVGVSILEDERFGAADCSKTLTADHPKAKQSKRTQTAPFLSAIFEERRRQDAKWGHQHHTPEEFPDWASFSTISLSLQSE